MRILSLDLSLTSPGFAVLDVKNGVPKLTKVTHFKTVAATEQALRYEEIEAFALLFIRENKPFDVIVRETWPPARNYAQNNKIHGAWTAVERALLRYGYDVEAIEHITPTSVKKYVGGGGKAEKEQVAEGARKLLGLPDDFVFKTDDESDACAVGLAYLIREKIIKGAE